MPCRIAVILNGINVLDKFGTSLTILPTERTLKIAPVVLDDVSPVSTAEWKVTYTHKSSHTLGLKIRNTRKSRLVT